MDVLRWENNSLSLLDQTKLPECAEYLSCSHYLQVARAIKEMRVRGAPAIGIAAAFGYVLAAFNFAPEGRLDLDKHLAQAALELKRTRPTAVNLAWAIDRMNELYQEVRGSSQERIRAKLIDGAQQLLAAQKEQDESISAFGNAIIPPQARIMTYCNTGKLATAGSGTALGIITGAHRVGKSIHVYVPETRPLLQGARLTVWELEQAGVPFTLITDNMAGYLFSQKLIDLVIVGADRIVANGDFANKIGTYGLAVLAAYHRRPFYVTAPSSTFDFSLGEGKEIPVEMRDAGEIRTLKGRLITSKNCAVLNPSFDVTPHELVSGYITEMGILKPPFAALNS